MRSVSFRNGMRRRQFGQGMTEYIIITALIAIAAIAAVTFFGGTVRAHVGAMGRELGGTDAGDLIKRATKQGNKAGTAGEQSKDLSSYGSAKEVGAKD
jgi:pilus assembly protein Flp/PilA